MREWFARYGKSLALFAGAVVVVIKAVLPDGVQVDEWFMIASAVVGGVATYIVPNLTGGMGRYAKALTYAAGIVIGALPAALMGGITPTEWVDLAVLVAANLGVVVLPAQQHQVTTTVVRPAAVPRGGR